MSGQNNHLIQRKRKSKYFVDYLISIAYFKYMHQQAAPFKKFWGFTF